MKKLLATIAVILLMVSPVAINATTVPQDTLDHIDRNVVRIVYSWDFNDVYGDSYTWSTQVGGVIIASDKILSVFHAALERPHGTFRAHIVYPNGNGRWDTLTLIKHDRLKDLILLQMDKPVSWQPIKLAEGIEWGEDILIAGFSMIPYPKIRLGRLITKYFPKKDRTDIFVEPSFFGDSGGFIGNVDGELVGIISHSFSFTHKNIRQDPLCSYGIPLYKVKEFLSAKQRRFKTVKNIKQKQFKKEFMEWLSSREIKLFFKHYKEDHPKGYKELIKFLREQIKNR